MKNNLILASCILFVLHSCAPQWKEVQTITAPDRATEDCFGRSIAISGNNVIVGADGKDDEMGMVYFFEKNETNRWGIVQKLAASDRIAKDRFGFSVAIDGNYAVVGAFQKSKDDANNNSNIFGSAYVFEKNSKGTWNEVQKITALEKTAAKHFGYSVSISGDYIIIGAPMEGTTGDRNIGGAAYIFKRDESGIWNELQKIEASDKALWDNFGHAVSINGNIIIVGANQEDNNVLGGDQKSMAGSAYIFEKKSNERWHEVQKIIATDRDYSSHFGGSVAISDNFIVIGAVGSDEGWDSGAQSKFMGAAYIFKKDSSGTWYHEQKITAADKSDGDQFGSNVSISDNYIVVGTYMEDEDQKGGNTLSNAGSAYIFKRDMKGKWNETQKIVASDREKIDLFGTSVSIDGTVLLVGSVYQKEDFENKNPIHKAGSVYVFEIK
jgi:hypothetical protein